MRRIWINILLSCPLVNMRRKARAMKMLMEPTSRMDAMAEPPNERRNISGGNVLKLIACTVSSGERGYSSIALHSQSNYLYAQF